MKPIIKASGIARMEVVKGAGAVRGPRPIESINDPDELRRIAQERHIAFTPTATVERMKKRLMEG